MNLPLPLTHETPLKLTCVAQPAHPAPATDPLPFPPPQCASKHAIVGLSKTMAKEYATAQVRVNVVAPGGIETPLLEEILDQAPGTERDYAEGVPMKRIGQPEEVASVICFLLGPEASYVTVSRGRPERRQATGQGRGC